MKKLLTPVTIVLMLVVLAAVVLSSAQRAAAIPSFSREHGLKCSDCHAGFPLLNEFGMEFKQRGFRLPGENGKYPWELKSLPVSMIGTMQYLNAHENDPVTKARLSTTSKAEIDEIEIMAAGTAAPKVGFLAEFAQEVAAGGSFGNEQIWMQFSDLLPASALNLLDSSQLLGVANGVDGPRMSTAGKYHESPLLDMYYHGLVVMDRGVLLPLICNAGIVNREAPLEGCRAMDLPRHQHEIPQEKGWPPLFDELDAFLRQDTPIRRGKIEFVAIGKDNLSFKERVRMQEQRHLALP